MVQGGGPEVNISEERLRRYRTRVPPVDTMYPHLQNMRSNMKELTDLWSRASQFPGLPSRSPSRLSTTPRSVSRFGAESPSFSSPVITRTTQYTRVTSEGAPNRSLIPRTSGSALPVLSCPSCHTDMAPPTPGIRSTCRGCKETYSVVHCPFCEGPNYFPGDSFVQGQDTRCAHCYRTFSLVLCPRCAERFYSDRFLQGVKTICNSCTYSYSMVSCPKCNTPNFWPSDEFMQGELTECSRCLHQFSMVLCNRCGIATFWAGRVPEILSVRCADCEMASPADRLDSTLFVPDIPLRPSSPSVSSQLGSRSPRSGVAPRYPPFVPPAAPFGAAPAAVALPPHELRGQYCTRELCRQFVRSLNLPAIYFDPTYDECYCDDCYREDEPDISIQGGRKYVVPRQWTRFGLRIDPVRTEVDNIWRDWCISYHGLNEKVLPSVLYHRQLLLPGDVLLDGSILEGNTDREPLMYTSPSINYSSLFSPPIEFTTADGQVLHAQMVLQCRQKPGTFMAKPGNPNVTRESCPFIPHQQVEYCSNTLSSIVPYGLLIRICE